MAKFEDYWQEFKTEIPNDARFIYTVAEKFWNAAVEESMRRADYWDHIEELKTNTD